MADRITVETALETRTVAKVLLRLIPCIVALYIFNYLDRVNVSFAKLTMNADLGFSETVYGLGSGIFFVSYFLFEIPSNLIMQRVGARIWLARIMISWGIISSAMMFVRGETSFYLLRFLLGAAEAGFAPGILLYLTYWLPLRHQAKAVAWFLTATALSGMIGSPLAGALLRLDGAHCFGHPLAGWQWLFLLEGVPSVLGGFAIYFLLTDKPHQARWLTAEEREWLTGRIEADRRQREGHGHVSLAAALADWRVWFMGLIYGTMMFGFQGINFWLATIVKQVTGLTDNLYVGLLCAIPFTAAMIAMVLLGRHSDRTGERRGHAAVCCAVGALGLLLCALSDSPIGAVACLALAAAGIWSSLGPFWALPPMFLSGSAAAVGLALINSIGNLGGGFLGQYVMGALRDYSKTYKPGLLVVSISLAVASGLILSLRRFLRTLSEPK